MLIRTFIATKQYLMWTSCQVEKCTTFFATNTKR